MIIKKLSKLVTLKIDTALCHTLRKVSSVSNTAQCNIDEKLKAAESQRNAANQRMIAARRKQLGD